MQAKVKIKKNDTVKVISGNYKGTQGRVLAVIPEKNRAIVEGVNIVSKHARPSTDNPQGGIVKKEATIHISNLMVVDSAGNATRVGKHWDEKTEKFVRYSKKSGEDIK